MKIERIISGGQTGADRGALDAAIEVGVSHGGWCPKGRLAEDGTVPERYGLKEAPVDGYPARTRLNVEAAEATVIFSVGSALGRGSRLTIRACIDLQRQVKCINLEVGRDEALTQLREWRDNCHNFGVPIRTLNVAGSRESSAPGIQRMVHEVMCVFLNDK